MTAFSTIWVTIFSTGTSFTTSTTCASPHPASAAKPINPAEPSTPARSILRRDSPPVLTPRFSIIPNYSLALDGCPDWPELPLFHLREPPAHANDIPETPEPLRSFPPYNKTSTKPGPAPATARMRHSRPLSASTRRSSLGPPVPDSAISYIRLNLLPSLRPFLHRAIEGVACLA